MGQRHLNNVLLGRQNRLSIVNSSSSSFYSSNKADFNYNARGLENQKLKVETSVMQVEITSKPLCKQLAQ
jgi:hypothetical protein